MNEKLYEVKNQLAELSSKKGRGTELVSVYIPPNKQLSDVAKHMREEYSQSANIKSKRTRKNVQSAIDSVVQRIKLFQVPPTNGLVIFTGMVDKMETYLIEPPEPIKTYMYHCDSVFLLDPIQYMFEEKDVYGFIVMDRNEATIAILRGKTINVVKTLTSGVPGKHTKGGQSQQRFARLIEEQANEFLKRIAKYADEAFSTELKGIIIGGPGFTKEDFIKKEYMNHELRKKILGTVDTCYTEENGIKEALEKSKDILHEAEIMKEKEILQKFMGKVGHKNTVLYGEKEVIYALQTGSVQILLLSEDIGRQELLTGLAEDSGATTIRISTETEEGKQFFRAFGGIGAILRY